MPRIEHPAEQSLELANGTLPVSRIARQAGYPDVSSFTRTFKASYGLPPARYRSEGSHAVYQAAVPTAESFTLPAGQAVEVQTLPALQLLAVEHRGSYMGIGQAFERLFGTLAAHGLARPGMRTLGLYHDEPDAIDQAALRSHAAVSGAADPGAALPAGLQRIALPAARCAALLHQGPCSSMRAAYRWLFGTWLPHSGFDIADAPIVEDYLGQPAPRRADRPAHAHLPAAAGLTLLRRGRALRRHVRLARRLLVQPGHQVAHLGHLARVAAGLDEVAAA
jgi:AraC family transcriptional regulator